MTDADFKYLTENILTDGQCLLSNTVLPSKCDRLNFDGLAEKHQNCQNFPLYGIIMVHAHVQCMHKPVAGILLGDMYAYTSIYA